VNPGPQTNKEGDKVELRLQRLDTRTRGAFSAANLPQGVHLDQNRGVIRGKIQKGAAALSPYTVIVTYTAPNGLLSTAEFLWTIVPGDR
jgi:hypothetical protein